MRQVWKYGVDVGADNVLAMPKGAAVLHFGAQGDNLCLWVLVDPERGREDRRVAVIGTGWPVEWHGQAMGCPNYLGTVQVGSFVWHAFEDLS